VKTKLIVNPNADLGRAWRTAADLRYLVEEHGGADWTGTVYPTHAIELARQAAEAGYELVIAAGGDGTVHEVVNGIMQVPEERRPRLGIIPLGSGNDFAHAIGLPANPAEALRQAFIGQPKAADLGLFLTGHGRREYFDNALGIGFDTTVTIRSRKLIWLRGFLIYLVAVLQTIILNHDAPHMKVTTDQEAWEDDSILFVIGNGFREGGGFLVTPKALPDDGLLHYASIRHVTRLKMLRLLPEVMKGTHGNFTKDVRMGVLRKIELHADRPLYIHADGEIISGFGSTERDLTAEIIPAAVEVMV
jgi:YegS/Rv2252/BmrU family lipid kinase